LLWTDQQRPDTIGAYHAAPSRAGAGTGPRTPAIDRLAAAGVLFEQAYCTQPVCSPSRASVLTGLYPHTHGLTTNGLPLPAAYPTLAELLKPAGYACGYVGKWHLGREHTPQRGFEDFWASTEDYGRSYPPAERAAPRRSAYQQFLLRQGIDGSSSATGEQKNSRELAARLPEELSKPAFQAAEAIRFLEAHRDRPFLLSVNFLEPHPPYFGPFDGLYAPEDVPLPRSWYREMEDTVPLRYRRREAVLRDGMKGRLETNDEAGWKALKARYWGNCTLVDKYAGRILDALDDLGLAEDTIVVYTSDHGEMMGEHRLLAKETQYEGSIRVPLIIRVPGADAGRITTPVSQVSLAPTLLGSLGLPLPPHLQGEDLGPLLLAGHGTPRDGAAGEVFVEWNGPPGYPKRDERPERLDEPEAVKRRLAAPEARTIRRGRWKLNVHASGEHELYDLEDDPDELHNAFYDRGNGAVIEMLLERLLGWQRRTGDSLALPEVRVVPA
jgi:arylsulfatase A-like enzyme